MCVYARTYTCVYFCVPTGLVLVSDINHISFIQHLLIHIDHNKGFLNLVHFQIRTVNNSSIVTSVLSFQPSSEDDGTVLKCEGSNPRLQNSVLEDSVIMNVLCK